LRLAEPQQQQHVRRSSGTARWRAAQLTPLQHLQQQRAHRNVHTSSLQEQPEQNHGLSAGGPPAINCAATTQQQQQAQPLTSQILLHSSNSWHSEGMMMRTALPRQSAATHRQTRRSLAFNQQEQPCCSTLLNSLSMDRAEWVLLLTNYLA
jgi:hypothetical protein